MIYLVARHKTDDHLWFNFFQEAAQILLHSKKCKYVDETSRNGAELELEANERASKTLVPQRPWEQFVAASPRGERNFRAFAGEDSIWKHKIGAATTPLLSPCIPYCPGANIFRFRQLCRRFVRRSRRSGHRSKANRNTAAQLFRVRRRAT